MWIEAEDGSIINLEHIQYIDKKFADSSGELPNIELIYHVAAYCKKGKCLYIAHSLPEKVANKYIQVIRNCIKARMDILPFARLELEGEMAK